MKWDEQAKEALSRVPFFVRKRVKKRVEEEAIRCGAKEVTPQHLRTCQRRFLDRMEEEVKGHRVETCFGQSGCPNRAAVSDHLSSMLEERISQRDLKAFLKQRVQGPLKMHHEFRLLISDCPNACSRPQIADVGIIGACVPQITDEPCTECGACTEACRESAILITDGRPIVNENRCLYCGQCVSVCPTGCLQEGKKGYRILVGGKLGRHPRLAEELPEILDLEDALDTVDGCLDLYQRHCRHGERLGEILERLGPGGLLKVRRQNTGKRTNKTSLGHPSDNSISGGSAPGIG